MKMYFSPSERGFFCSEIHGESIPKDAVEVTAERHAELMAGQAQGKQIAAGKGGRPVLVSAPERTESEVCESVRKARDKLLKETDWVAMRAFETGQPVPKEWVDYRQALRDITTQKGFPTKVTWPTAPKEAA